MPKQANDELQEIVNKNIKSTMSSVNWWKTSVLTQAGFFSKLKKISRTKNMHIFLSRSMWSD